ncbi:hypothetical protein BTO13_02340 [Polaribacter gangjinensis]|uniref:Uncharacterized protein n=1 Tax=Polaribacter gangjinensis TaxID=574710 RepID=A0A2S7W968_9FLAO|nr:hypothetical protein [Polaribacter gangjinensis]PQJ74184.1 hypothetical protein BTO13_02340 [Polaribacter gangjinensis]
MSSVINSYATTPHLFSSFSYFTAFQENTSTTNQIDEAVKVEAFKPSINIANELFIIEEIPVEDVEEQEESLSHKLKKSVVSFYSSALLYRVLFENASLKTKENSHYQNTFATHVAVNLYQKFEVYRI